MEWNVQSSPDEGERDRENIDFERRIIYMTRSTDVAECRQIQHAATNSTRQESIYITNSHTLVIVDRPSRFWGS